MDTFAPEKVKPARRPRLIVGLVVVLVVVLAVVLTGFLLWLGGSPGMSTGSREEAAPATTLNAGSNSPIWNLTQTNEGGQVTLTATRQLKENSLSFTIALNTHSVDLDGYDLSQLALLRTDQGREVLPSSWDAPKGGHHRQGTLTFPATTADGRPVVAAGTQYIELVIKGVGGVSERVLRWAL